MKTIRVVLEQDPTAVRMTANELLKALGELDPGSEGYIDLAGETFRAEAELLEQRLFGAEPVPKAGTKTA